MSHKGQWPVWGGCAACGCQSHWEAGLTNEEKTEKRITNNATNFKPVSSFYDMQPEKRID